MPKRTFTTIDGNEAVAHVAYRTNEVIAIYPITPSSPIGESADAWSSVGKPNICGWRNANTNRSGKCGAMSQVHCANPAEFERAQYVRALQSLKPVVA